MGISKISWRCFFSMNDNKTVRTNPNQEDANSLHGGNCVRLAFNELDFKMTVGHPAYLQGSQEEADTLLAYHAASATNVYTGMLWPEPPILMSLFILLGMLGRHRESHRETSYSLIIMDREIIVDILMSAALPTPWSQSRRD
jgi:hypothetical protein